MAAADIIHRLEKLENEIAQMKKNAVDPDTIMTEEDYNALLAYREEKNLTH